MHGGHGSMIIIRGFWMEYCEKEILSVTWLFPFDKASPVYALPLNCTSLCDVRAFGSLWDGLRVFLAWEFLACVFFFFLVWGICNCIGRLAGTFYLSRVILFHYSFFPLFHVIWDCWQLGLRRYIAILTIIGGAHTVQSNSNGKDSDMKIATETMFAGCNCDCYVFRLG